MFFIQNQIGLIYIKRHKKLLSNANPIRKDRLIPQKADLLRNHLEEMKAHDWIEDSDICFVSPAALVPNQNGDIRMVCDYPGLYKYRNNPNKFRKYVNFSSQVFYSIVYLFKSFENACMSIKSAAQMSSIPITLTLLLHQELLT